MSKTRYPHAALAHEIEVGWIIETRLGDMTIEWAKPDARRESVALAGTTRNHRDAPRPFAVNLSHDDPITVIGKAGRP